jgi:hypothetical protein
MTDNINLPRAVVEKVRDSLDYVRRFNGASESTGLAALDAALAEPPAKPEPVAWLRKDGLRFRRSIEPQDGSELPLYAAPPAAKPEPATDEQVAEAYKASYDNGWFWRIFCDTWREAERWHGIRKEDQT